MSEEDTYARCSTCAEGVEKQIAPLSAAPLSAPVREIKGNCMSKLWSCKPPEWQTPMDQWQRSQGSPDRNRARLCVQCWLDIPGQLVRFQPNLAGLACHPNQ